MFEVEREIPWEELEPQIRLTTLLGQPDAFPYADAAIEFRHVPSQCFDDYSIGHTREYEPVLATTKYVLKANLAFQKKLQQDLNRQGYDQLSLWGGLVLRNTETSDTTVLVPPIIEADDNGAYVLDGTHRIWNGRQERYGQATTSQVTGRHVLNHPVDDYEYAREDVVVIRHWPISTIYVSNPSVPGYARPNRWCDIKVLDEVPANPADKKDYRFDYPGGYKALYRDFSHLGSSGLRSCNVPKTGV